MDSQRWWCLLSKNYSILNLGEFFHSEKYRVFTQYAAATLLRHWATMSYTPRKSVFNFRDIHDDVIKWKHFPRYWPFERGIRRSPVNSPHKGQWRRALMFSLICVWINGWVNNREAGDLRRYRAHYDVIVMFDNNVNFGTAESRHFLL